MIVWVLFLIGSPRTTFLCGGHLHLLHVHHPLFAFIAIPLTLVIITGEIDLSLASVMAFGMVGYDVVFVATGELLAGILRVPPLRAELRGW